jgi:hypothetical protein
VAAVKPQTQAVLNLLQSQGSAGVTPLQAMHDVGTMRLAARVAELREAGYVITTYDFTTASGKRVARYVLRHPEPSQMALDLMAAVSA